MSLNNLFDDKQKIKLIKVQRWFEQKQNGQLAHCLRILFFYSSNGVTDSFDVYPADVNFKFLLDISETSTTKQSIIQ